jgi:type IV secretory pathway VirB10-like protein
MAEQTGTPEPAPIKDRRVVPRGVLPRGFQTWLMAGLALGIVLIVMLTGHREPPARPAAAPATPPAPNGDRVRDYQDQLRTLEERMAREAQAAAIQAPAPRPEVQMEPRTNAPEDPIVADRRRREYESLFASNVVLSRRPDAQRPDAPTAPRSTQPSSDQSAPSIDDIADAVVRATMRTSTTAPSGSSPTQLQTPQGGTTDSRAESRLGERGKNTPGQTDPINPAGPLHRLLEGTFIDTVLANRLDGDSASPVNCLVTNPIYSHSGQHIVIPAGARVLGETRAVQSLGETRLAVAFHRLLMPDGRTHSLDQFLGLNQIGDAGLRDRVNHHYLSTFGAAGAVGLISGLAQWLGTAGFTGGTGDRTVIIAGGATDATAQASLQVMNRFLNRLPTITIREGHRVKVYLTSDLELPAYEPMTASRF